MKGSDKGFGVVEVLLIIVTVGVLGFAGWYFFSRQNNDANKTSQSTPTSTEQNSEDIQNGVDMIIHEVNISLKTEADLAKLPEYTPESFRTYFAEKLRDNKPFGDGKVTLTQTWQISKISKVNIQGGGVPTDDEGNSYPGGAPAIWVLTPTGGWDEETLNGPVCVSKNGGKIYEEFVTTCFDDAHPGGVKNPNGSIRSIGR